jgi:hypothetical protein
MVPTQEAQFTTTGKTFKKNPEVQLFRTFVKGCLLNTHHLLRQRGLQLGSIKRKFLGVNKF